jgi:hypothetical protein
MKKFNLYIGLTLGLVLTAILLTYYIMDLSMTKKRARGYEVVFWNPPTCGDDSIYKRMRVYKTYNLTSDTLKNDSILKLVRKGLNKLKSSFDSINGIHIQMTNDMSYKYYLESIGIFNEHYPKLFIPIANHFYAFTKSKHQLVRDSIGYRTINQGIEIILRQ